jgi:hypothetical protein
MSSRPAQLFAMESALIDWFGRHPLIGTRLPVALLSNAQKADELQRVVAARAMLAAYEATSSRTLAAERPTAPTWLVVSTSSCRAACVTAMPIDSPADRP